MATRRNAPVPLSRADSAWLQMEHPTNLMMITAMFRLKGHPDPEQLRQILLERLCSYDRFRMRVLPAPRPLGVARWDFDPDFNIDRHFSVTERVRPMTDEQLLELVNELMSTPLDRRYPLWHFELVTPVDGGSALVVRLHHAIADGIALMKVLLRLVDEPEEEVPVLAAPAARRAPSAWGARLPGEARVPLGPGRILDLAVEAAGALTRLVSKRADPPSPLKGPLGRDKRAALTPAIPLDAIKAAGKSLGATVNDILMTILADSLGRYLSSRGREVKRVRAVVPVDLRDPRDRFELGNKFGLVFLSLPLAPMSVAERITIVKRRMDRLKKSPESVVVFGILNSVGGLPAELEKRLVELFGAKATAVVTNVPGPGQALSMAGCPIESLMFWVPQSGRLGLGISILSYAGQVRVGIASDAGLIPEPQELARHFQAAYEDLLAVAATPAGQA